jgi:membrane protease YdiL (CAAX protease family)
MKKKLGIFFGLTVLFSGVFYCLIARAGTMQARGGLYVFGLMSAPGISALMALGLTERTLRGAGWKWGKTRWQLLSIALPLGLIGIVYGLIWLTGLGGVPNPEFVREITTEIGFPISRRGAILIYVLVTSAAGLAGTALPALGEEIGWRGLLAPALYRLTGFTGAALISGFIWALWHYPGMLLADYHGETPLWFGMLCFTVMAVGFSFVLTWFRLKTGSVWTAMFLHASHNVFVQTIFTPLTADTGPTEFFVGEFGVGLAAGYLIAAIFFWKLREQLPPPPGSSS